MNATRYIRTSGPSLIPHIAPKWGYMNLKQVTWKKRFFSSNELQERVAIVGSGNFGSAMSIIIGRNAKQHAFVHDEVKMWVHEEEIGSIVIMKISSIFPDLRSLAILLQSQISQMHVKMQHF